jgi:membrane protein
MSDTKDPTAREAQNVPAAEDKPEKPTEIHKQSWKFIARKVLREFGADQCTDLAAALTYYAVLALFPAIVALISIVGVVGQPTAVQSAMTTILKPLVNQQTFDILNKTVTQLTSSSAAGIGLVIGLLGALWSASGYVGAFGRAMNRIYEIDEGRPFWKLRPVQLIVTLIAVVLIAVVLVALVLSGPLATTVGNSIGLGSTAVTVFNIAKFPVIAAMVVVIVALLYYATPNVKQPKFKWVSVGAVFAILVWVVASIAFAFYVSNFGSYNKTYGSLAGVVVTLLWLWITNIALLLGAEIDSELERGRELQAGLPAEVELQLPARDTRNIKKAREKEQVDIERAREIRERAEREGSGTDDQSRAQSSDGATTLRK